MLSQFSMQSKKCFEAWCKVLNKGINIAFLSACQQWGYSELTENATVACAV